VPRDYFSTIAMAIYSPAFIAKFYLQEIILIIKVKISKKSTLSTLASHKIASS